MKTQQEKDFHNELKSIFAKNLYFWTSKRNIKQVDIVNRLGVSKSTVSTWFNPNNPKMPTTDNIQKLAEMLDINLSDLLGTDSSSDLVLSEHERKLIFAYRDNKSMQAAVDTLLKINESFSTDELIVSDIKKTVDSTSTLFVSKKKE